MQFFGAYPSLHTSTGLSARNDQSENYRNYDTIRRHSCYDFPQGLRAISKHGDHPCCFVFIRSSAYQLAQDTHLSLHNLEDYDL